MNKNCIEGRRGLVSWHNTAKPFGSATEVNAAVVQGSTVFLPGEASLPCVAWFKSTTKGIAVRSVMFALCNEESAEGIVVVDPRAMIRLTAIGSRRTWRSRTR